MSTRFARFPGWEKPPWGTPIDGGHHVSSGLIIACPINEGGGSILFDCAAVAGEMDIISPNWQVSRKGIALYTDNNEYALSPHRFTVDFLDDEFTCLSIIEPTNLASNRRYFFFGEYDIYGGDFDWGLYITGSYNVELYVETTGDVAQSCTAPGTLAIGVPTVLLGRYDGSYIDLWFDGRRGTPAAQSGNVESDCPNMPGFMLGRQWGSSKYCQLRQIAAVVWNRALTDAEMEEVSAFPFCMYKHSRVAIAVGPPPTTLLPTTLPPTTLPPTTLPPTTLPPTTLPPTTLAPTTLPPTTLAPTTLPPTTLPPTTLPPTTLPPTTLPPTTLPPTTLPPTTLPPTTLAPTTLAPTTLPPTTLPPTTLQPTTLPPTTLPPTTLPPTTLPPTTLPPTTLAPTTIPPTTLPPTTLAPTTLAPTTLPPTTLAPTTLPPTTLAPTTLPPTTLPPTTLPPTTLPPTTLPPTTLAPTTLPPTTLPPTTLQPTTIPPTTLPPTTLPPTTLPPTTLAPTTLPPTTLPPTTLAPTTPPPPTTTVPTTPPIVTTVPPTTIIPTTAPPDVARAIFETEGVNPPTFETARAGQDVSAGSIEVTITALVQPGHFYRLREAAPNVTIIRWIEYNVGPYL